MKINNKKSISLLLAACSFAFVQPSAQAQMDMNAEKFYRAPRSMHGKQVVIPVGSHFEGRMNDTISSTTRQGQKFSIEITSPILANGTDVLIPIGSRVIGEVVEAIPSNKQRKIKYMPKPLGKLRTQLSALTTPDGMTYPLVASIVAEYGKLGSGRTMPNRDLMGNPSMGYVGSQASFDAVDPNFDKRGGNMMKGPTVIDKRTFFRDPINGVPRFQGGAAGTPVIRSIVRKGNEIYIYSGSPLTLRVDAPLKMGIAPSKGELSIDIDPVQRSLDEAGSDRGYRRFKPISRVQQEEQEKRQAEEQRSAPPPLPVPQQIEPQEPDDGIPAFLKKAKKNNVLESPFAPTQQQPQGGVPMQAPPQGVPAQAPPQNQQQPPLQFQQQQPGIPPQTQQKPGDAF